MVVHFKFYQKILTFLLGYVEKIFNVVQLNIPI